MPMVGVLIDEGIGSRVRIEGMWPFEMRAREVMPEVAVDGVNEKEFPMLIPIMGPRIGCAGTEHFHHFALGMITPDRPAQRNAFRGWSAGSTKLAGAGSAAPSIQPAVRPETQSVSERVMHVRRARKAVQHDF